MAFSYPAVDRDNTSDVLHGVVVADPYRYLEDPDADRTKAFVEAQNRVSEPYLAALPGRAEFGATVLSLLTAERRGVPWERAGRYFAVNNPGSLDQDQLFVADSLAELAGGGRLLLDPNTWSADGTAALTAVQVSPDGELVAYARSDSGSDWRTIRVREVRSGRDRPDVLRWTKWVDPTWLSDSSGFAYWRYPAPSAGEFTDAMVSGELLLHRLGGDQSEDILIWSRPDDANWGVDPWFSPDGRWMVLVAAPGTDSRTTVVARRMGRDSSDLAIPDGQDVEVVGELADAHSVVGSEGDTLFLRTERDAPFGRLIGVQLNDLAQPWQTLIEGTAEGVLVGAWPAADTFAVLWSIDAAHRLEVTDREGNARRPVDFGPSISVTAVHGRAESSQVFVGISSFMTPSAGYLIALDNGVDAGAVVPKALPSATGARRLPSARTERRFGRSIDGTMVPMTVVRRADLPDGPHPTLLYGYGGFDIPLAPSFSAMFAAWVAAGGVLAVANLRGGGEFGARWHSEGMLHHKQRVFDDLYGCATALVDDGVTTAGQLAVHGRSNGGLLVGAAMTQRPELFAAALPTVGVLDMLRFHLFTIGRAWTAEYGDPDDAADFPVILEYSPLHNLRAGVAYPPTLVCTGDHDDRVVPAHSLKFAAQLQHCQAGDAPVLLRVDTRAGHGVGKPVTALAAEYADQLSFAAKHTGLTPMAW